MSLSNLIAQHRSEILRLNNYDKIVKQTCNTEFMNMFHLSVFVPILHAETPKPQAVSKKPLKWKGLDEYFPTALFDEVMEYRETLRSIQIERKAKLEK
jgi:hypothetical protein